MSPDERRLELRLLDDSDDARLFVELCSHATDLVEARDALLLALRSMPDPDSPFQDAERSLVANATMAYCRTFFPSKVRRPITEYVEIPHAFAATHELVAKFRNRTIAHSQSDLLVTYAVAVLDAETREVLDLSGPSVTSTMPPEQVRAFLGLVHALEGELDEVIDPIRTRLKETLVGVDLSASLDGRRPEIRELPASEFGSPSTRPPYPTSHPIYLSS